MRVVRNTTMLVAIAAGADGVVAWAPMPAGARLLSVTGELHLIGAEAAPVDAFAAYGFSGEVVPVVDPDGAIDVNLLWDNMVTKPVEPITAAATIGQEFDFDTTQVNPDVEPGEVDLADISGMLDPGKRIFAPTIEWLSAAKGTPMAVVAGTPDTYTPKSYKTFRSQANVSAEMESYALLAVSSPSLDKTQAAATIVNSPQQWGILQNLRNVMEDFWRIQVGMTEAGAETPYAEISTMIGDLVSPDMVQASTFVDPLAYRVLCHATWLLDMPGSSIPGTLAGHNE